MHAYVLLPLASAIGAAVLGSAIASHEPDRRANRLMGAQLLGAGVWALFEVLWHTAPEADLAAAYMRWANLGAIPLGALLLHLLVTSAPDFQRYRPLLLPAYALAAAGAAAAVGTDLVVAGAVRTRWGFVSVPGEGLVGIYALVSSVPVAAALSWIGRSLGRPGGELPWRSPVVLAGAACFVVASLTQVVLPELGIDAPRLGSASIVAWGGIAWWTVYRFREPHLAPRRFAREILDTLPDGVALVRPDGRIRSSNERLAQLAEREAGDLLGAPLDELLCASLDALLGERPAGGGEAERECELVAASGRRIPVSISRTPLVDEEGHTVGHVLAVHDLREVVALRSRLVASGRLVAVGQLAAGIAHEINNPIAYVRSNLRLLQEHWPKLAGALGRSPRGPLVGEALDEGPELLGEASEGIDRVAQIVRDVGGFSRGGVVEEEPACLDQLLETAVRVAAPQLKRHRIEHVRGSLPPVRCVPQDLIQVFLNLLLNASHACGSRGCIRLATHMEGDTAVVEVSDDGHGIAPELRERLFEPFFTTKPVGEGTGLGLSISQQIVASHDGRIEVESAPGRGTTFRILLPLRSAPASGSGSHASGAGEDA